MNIPTITEALKEYSENQVTNYCAYLQKLLTEKQKKGNEWVIKNPWMSQRTDAFLIRMFNLVASDGLVFDGQDITLQSTGVSYNYQAYKNKMFLAYPESVIDISLVHENDTFKFSKNSGKVEYLHDITDPFENDEKQLVGGYCVIKNKRGEFLTLLSKADIDKHRRVAKTDSIWKQWFHEMALKTVVKKACKQHFKDVYSNIETLDNENYDLEQLEYIDAEKVAEIKKLIKETAADENKFLAWGKCKSIESLPIDQYNPAISLLKAKVKK